MSTSSITTVITDAGFSLLRAAPGHKLIYTRAVCGSGYVEKTQLATQTEVTDYVMDLSIVEFGPTESAATLRLQLDNSKAPKEFQLYQIGIFAKLLDEEQELIGETLIQIMQYEEPDIVRAVPHVSEFVVNVLLGQAEKVEGIIDMAAYVSLRHFSSRTVNGKPLSADVTLTGEDINVSDSDPTTVKAALSNKADILKQLLSVYVDGVNGDDSNSGTKQAPFKTINAALNSIPTVLIGTVIINIAAGTYEENVSIAHFVGGTSQFSSINIIGAGQDKTFIQGLFTVHSNVPTYIKNVHISKGGNTGMVGTYYNTTLWENVTIEGSGMIHDTGPCFSSLGGYTFFNNVTVNNAPVEAIQASGAIFIHELAGTGNNIGIRVGLSPGYLGMAVVSSIPDDFATANIYKVFSGSIVIKGGALV